MKILISNEDFEFLEKLNLPITLLNQIEQKNNRRIVNYSIADKVRDFCIEKSDEIGLDENYELTPEGRILEKLIDKLLIE